MLWFFLIVTLLGLSNGQFNNPIITNCLMEEQVDFQNALTFITTGKFNDNDTNLQCFFRCLMFNSGVIDEAGTFSAKKFIDNMTMVSMDAMNRAAMESHINSCNNGETYNRYDPCIKFFDKIKCFMPK